MRSAVFRVGVFGLLGLSCSAATPAVVPEVEPEVAPSTVMVAGICDASAAVLVDGALLIANDEDASLYRTALSGEALGSVLLGPEGAELDLEGAAVAGGMVWWVGSLGNNKRGEARPERSYLIATTPAGVEGGRVSLREPLLAAIAPLVGERPDPRPLPPKAGGLNVEGLAADSEGRLWMGLRSPLVGGGEAVVVRLENPREAVDGKPAVFGAMAQLDLGGRGVRSMVYRAETGSWLLVAGPTDGGGEFGVYEWGGPGGTLAALPVDLRGLNVEGVVLLPENEVLVISDDGAMERGKHTCKKRWEDNPADSEVYFRMETIPLPK